jgi:hypothetical protein
MAAVSENVSALALKIWRFSLDKLLINFRFLDVALSGLKLKEQAGLDCVYVDISTPDKSTIYYDYIYIYYSTASLDIPTNIIRWTKTSGTLRLTWRWRTQSSPLICKATTP